MFAQPSICIGQNPVDLSSDFVQVEFQSLRVLKLALCFCFLDETLEKCFLLQERLEHFRGFRVGINRWMDSLW